MELDTPEINRGGLFSYPCQTFNIVKDVSEWSIKECTFMMNADCVADTSPLCMGGSNCLNILISINIYQINSGLLQYFTGIQISIGPEVADLETTDEQCGV